MAAPHPQALAERLFSTFLGPLVTGGELRPGKPFGGRAALSIGEGRAPTTIDLLAHVELARVRVARKLAPIDFVEATPTASEWALGAVLHDLVQAAHPGFAAAFRRQAPRRILTVAEETLLRIPPATDVGEGLSRHTWFSRMFDLARTDVDLSWWTGSRRFRGEEPPERLKLWPELRRVQETRTPRPLMDLPTSGSAVDPQAFTETIARFLGKTPLTDFATVSRPNPAFFFSQENLTFAATRNGRTLALRALSLLPGAAVDAALGAATRRLYVEKATRALLVAIDLLRERALEAARDRLGREDSAEPIKVSQASSAAAFAVGAGALAASHWIASTGGGFNEGDRRALLAVLAPAAKSPEAHELRALLAGG